MEFEIKKCAFFFIMKSGKREITEGIKQPNQESTRTCEEKENSQYLGKLELDAIKQR